MQSGETRVGSTLAVGANQGVGTVHTKNCEPLELGPLLAMLSTPGLSCFSRSDSGVHLEEGGTRIKPRQAQAARIH
jgi:hypothetical protein